MKDEKTNTETRTLGQRVKALRERHKLSQAKFGQYYNIPLRTIQDWETEKFKPPIYIIEMMEEIHKLRNP